MLTMKQVEESIESMDLKYEANFGDWIQNEVNSKTIGLYFRDYIKDNTLHDLIIVIKWIVKRWTLKSIIDLCANILIDNINCNVNLSLKKIYVFQGLIYTWNTEFILEFVHSLPKSLNQTLKLRFYANIFTNFSDQKINELVILLKEREVSQEIIKLIKERREREELKNNDVIIAFTTI